MNSAILLHAHAYASDSADGDPEQACRNCGCTERRCCYRPDIGPCSWSEYDLCSHCVPELAAEADADRERRAKRRWRAIALVFMAVWASVAVFAFLTRAVSGG